MTKNIYLPDEEWDALRDEIVAGGITLEQHEDEITRQFAIDIADEYLAAVGIMPESLRADIEGAAA